MFDGRHSSNWALYLKETSKKVWGMAFLYREPYVSKVCQPLSQKILEQHRKNISKGKLKLSPISFSWKRVDRISKNFVRKVNCTFFLLMKILCPTNFFMKQFVKLIFFQQTSQESTTFLRNFNLLIIRCIFVVRIEKWNISLSKPHNGQTTPSETVGTSNSTLSRVKWQKEAFLVVANRFKDAYHLKTRI